MSGRNRTPEAPPLFDLPLEPPAAEPRRPRAARRQAPGKNEPPTSLPLFPEEEGGPEIGTQERRGAAAPPPPPPTLRRRAPVPATLRQRLRAGLLDAGFFLALLATIAGGARLMGTGLRLADAPAVALFLAAFSFLYYVIPLAFWGQSPGMAAVGLVARGPRAQPLTLGQTVLRWLGAAATAATLGLPLLLAARGRPSLTDRLSGSRTYVRGP